jgi:hypothetical protein
MATINYASTGKSNNISSKMMQAQMIKSRKSLTYSNSQSMTIFSIILNPNFEKYHNLLINFGSVDTFQNYINRINRSPKYNDNLKASIYETFQNVILNLSDLERSFLGIIDESQEIVELTQEEQDSQQLQNPEKIYFCKVNSRFNQRYLNITNLRKDDLFVPGKKYIFDLQDSSNLGTQLSFSLKQYTYLDVPGLYFIGTPGTSGSYLVYNVPLNISQYKVFIYNKSDNTTDSFFLYAYMVKRFIVQVNYLAPSVPNTKIDTEVICMQKKLKLGAIETTSGIKYVLEEFKNVAKTNQENPISVANRYDSLRKYGFFYGSYIVLNNVDNYVTILNKNNEDKIQIFGNEDTKKVEYLSYLDADRTLDGSYNLYAGNFRLEVYADFGEITLYSYNYGINDMDNILKFDDKCFGTGAANTDYELVTSVDDDSIIHCLYPQSNTTIVEMNNFTSIRFNGETEYVSNRIYGLHDGQYMIFNIPEDHPIAFINKGREDYFQYEGVSFNKLTRIGPDGNIYNFYFGTIILYIYGDFGNISLYDYYNGYAGGKYLFKYTEICDFDSAWVADPEDIQENKSTYVSNIENNYEELDAYTDLSMNSYMFFNIVEDASGVKYIVLTDTEISGNETAEYNEQGIYELNTGTYVILNIPESMPITFLNKDIESSHFFVSGYAPYIQEGIGPDGEKYNFYYGNINIVVHQDFGRISIYTLNNGYLNGRKLFAFSEDAVRGRAILQNAQISSYPTTLDDELEAKPQVFYIDVNTNTIILPYSENFSTYRMFGYDRNGEIDITEDNPELVFYLGDTVVFSFIYNNAYNTLGVYEEARLITDPQIIQNNANTSKTDIIWTPTLAISNYYQYRSNINGTLMKGIINIINNNIIDIVPDLVSITPAIDSSNTSVEISAFSVVFDEIMNVSNNAYATLTNTSTGQVLSEYNVEHFSGSGSKTISIPTNFSYLSRLAFDSSYELYISNQSIRNIYSNAYDFGDYALRFHTEIEHAPLVTDISPSSNDGDISDGVLSDLSGTITITFNEDIQYIFGNYDYPFFTIKDSNNNISQGSTIGYYSENQLKLPYNTETASFLEYGTTYKLNFLHGSIKDLSYIDLDIGDSSLNEYYITIKPDPRPSILSISPDYDETGVAIDTAITITFNMDVYPGDSGFINIKEVDPASGEAFLYTFHQFNFSDEDDISAISGWGTDTISFTTPTPDVVENYNYETIYTVSIDNNVIRNSEDGTEYFTGLEELSYQFRTITQTT